MTPLRTRRVPHVARALLLPQVSQLQLGGYIISLVGFAGYNVVKATAASQASAALSHTNGASSPSTASKLA